jgi:hypothetical protein
MPVCVCVKRGQVRRDDGVIRFYEEGEKDTFKECPVLFTPLSSIVAEEVDMHRVNSDILRDNEIIPLSRLIAFYKDTYGQDLTGESRDRIVDKIVYARHNPIMNISDRGVAPLAHEFVQHTNPEPPLGSSMKIESATVEFSDDADDIPEPPKEDDIDDSLDDLLGEGTK